jgi:hypothetical protein
MAVSTHGRGWGWAAAGLRRGAAVLGAAALNAVARAMADTAIARTTDDFTDAASQERPDPMGARNAPQGWFDERRKKRVDERKMR